MPPKAPFKETPPVRRKVAIACQGGGSHTAFTAGALTTILESYFRGDLPDVDIIGFSGTSGGALCASMAWAALLAPEAERAAAVAALRKFWLDPYPAGNAAVWPGDRLMNLVSVQAVNFPIKYSQSPYKTAALMGLARWLPIPDMDEWLDARAALRKLLELHIDFEGIAERIRDLESRDAFVPRLFIGAVAVKTGKFTGGLDPAKSYEDRGEDEGFPQFHGHDAGFCVEAILASASLPELMTGQTVPGCPGEVFWDGLYSQNPPITPFLDDVPHLERPDEIWVIRINPAIIKNIPESEREITDRRNELAGNLALRQELDGIKRINAIADWLAQARAAAPDKAAFDALPGMDKLLDFKMIDTAHEITMSDHLSGGLGYGTKLWRDPDFLTTLFNDGLARARAVVGDPIIAKEKVLQ